MLSDDRDALEQELVWDSDKDSSPDGEFYDSDSDPTNNLHTCLICGDYLHAQNIIKSGVNVNEVKNGNSPLHIAVMPCYGNLKSSQFKLLQLLINYGADINFKNHVGNTPLHSCVVTFSLPEQLALVEYYKSQKGDCIVEQIPIVCHYQEILKIFLINGADTTIKNNDGKTVFELLPSFLEKYFLIYKDEVRKIKNIKLTAAKSLYDFLFMYPLQAVRLINNCTLQELREDSKEDFLNIFPTYGGMLNQRFLKCTRQKKCQDRAKQALKQLTMFNIPDLCYEELFNYLTECDLRNIRKSVKYIELANNSTCLPPTNLLIKRQKVDN